MAYLLLAALLAACTGTEPNRDPIAPGDQAPGVEPPSADKPYDVDEVLVRVPPGVDVEQLNRYYGTWTAGNLDSRRVFLLHCPPGSTVDDLLPEMEANPLVEIAEPNYRSEAPEAEARTSSMTFADAGEGETAFADQNALRRIRAIEALAFARGRGTIVAVLDTGLDYRHPRIAGNIAFGGTDVLDGDGDPSDTPDGVDSDGDGLVDEAVGHGTAVAGLILSVAPEAMILPLRILDSDGVGTAFAVARGLDVAARRRAGVVNMSFGMPRESRVIRDLLEELHARGSVLVASAGNRNVEAPLQYPAGESSVMAVAATDSLDRKADFSNFGSWVDVSAPGVGLVTPAPGGRYALWSGTSFAAAFVSGEAALLHSTPGSGEGRQLLLAIRDSAVPLSGSDPAFGLALGAGRIDVLAAIRKRMGDTTVAELPAGGSRTSEKPLARAAEVMTSGRLAGS